jgi:hypothetical protein
MDLMNAIFVGRASSLQLNEHFQSTKKKNGSRLTGTPNRLFSRKTNGIALIYFCLLTISFFLSTHASAQAITVSPTTICAGSSVTVSLTGGQKNSTYTVELSDEAGVFGSPPTSLGSLITGNSTSKTQSVTIPSGAVTGGYKIRLFLASTGAYINEFTITVNAATQHAPEVAFPRRLPL